MNFWIDLTRRENNAEISFLNKNKKVCFVCSQFGIIPEFIGRLPIIATLKELDKQALIKITTEPKNALVKQYKKLLKMDDVELEFKQEALEAIVDKAIERKTGARGLRSIIEEIMRDVMYDIPNNKIDVINIPISTTSSLL